MENTSSYQKLKQKNQQLMQDIYNLVINENKIEGLETKARYSMQFDLEQSILHSNLINQTHL